VLKVPIFPLEYDQFMFRGNQIRATVLTIFLFAGVLIFHHIGGGEFQIQPSFAILFIASQIYFSMKPMPEFVGPNLALAILAAQAGGHFMVNAPTEQSNLKMGLSHLIASILTYQFAKHFDRATAAYERAISYLFPQIPCRLVLNLNVPFISFAQCSIREIVEFVRRVVQERAPPISQCA
jgi:hypothetical protein